MTSKLVLFQLRGGSYALFVAEIAQILLAPPVFRLPLLSSNFEGVFLHKGALIPALAPGRMGGDDETAAEGTAGYLIVCTTEFGPVGLPADRVIRIVDMTAGQMQDKTAGEDDAGIFCFKGEGYPLVRLEILLGLQPCNQG
jgi:chemotaxis signal transduction protein